MNKKSILGLVLLLLLMPACYSLDELTGTSSSFSSGSNTGDGYTLDIWLSATEEEAATPADIEAAKNIITQRLTMADIDFAIELTDEELPQIRIRTNNSSEEVTPLIIRPGFLEFVDFSGMDFEDLPQTGACVVTDAQEAFYSGQTLCPMLGADVLTMPDGQPYTTIIDGDSLLTVEARESEFTSEWVVQFSLNDDAASTFADFTESHIGEPLAIVLDSEVVSAPVIQARIEGEGVIVGNYDQQEAESLATILQTGRLPIVLEMTGIKSFPDGDADYIPEDGDEG